MLLRAILNALTRVRQGRMSLCEPHFLRHFCLQIKAHENKKDEIWM